MDSYDNVSVVLFASDGEVLLRPTPIWLFPLLVQTQLLGHKEFILLDFDRDSNCLHFNTVGWFTFHCNYPIIPDVFVHGFGRPIHPKLRKLQFICEMLVDNDFFINKKFHIFVRNAKKLQSITTVLFNHHCWLLCPGCYSYHQLSCYLLCLWSKVYPHHYRSDWKQNI